MDAHALPAKSKLHRYEVTGLLGRGKFTITYCGLDTDLRQPVAIKEFFPRGHAIRDSHSSNVSPMLHTRTEDYKRGLKRFIDEARTLVKLRHANIVPVLDVFESNGTAYIVMEHVEGTALDSADIATTVWTEDELLALARGLLAGLEAIHGAHFIYRDLQPGSIIIRSDGHPVLIDFGTAGHAFRDSEHQVTIVVTPGFTPFEQYDPGQGKDSQGAWSDIYGAAAILYRLASGSDPTDALSRANAFLLAHQDCCPPIAEAAIAPLSAKLLAAIDLGLAFHTKERPRHVAQWREFLPPLPDEPAALELLRQKFSTCALPSSNLPSSSQTVTGPAPVAVPADSATTQNGPASSAAQGAVSSAEGRAGSGLEDLRILLVDDEPAIRALLARILKRYGITQITQANDADQALEQLDRISQPVDIIFSDLNMPGTDGVEFLRHLARRDLRAGIILVSGQDQRILQSAFTLAQSHSLYVLGTITKPFASDAVRELLSLYEREHAPALRRTIDKLSLEELREGIETDCLTVFYQPKVNVQTGRTVGVEALARWQRPNGPVLSPGSFIDLAENHGLIDKLTESVFSQAIEQGAEWQRAGLDLRVSVNFSVDTLNRYDLPEFILGQAAQAGLNPGFITLEVTESRMISDVKTPLEILTRLRLRNVGLSIDDFGTGHSSLEQIKRIPFTELKIDRSFVNGATRDPAAPAILKSSVDLGNSLSLDLDAEGVETQAEWDLVAETGCHEVQGFFIARPMPAPEIIPFVEQRGLN